MGPTPEFLILWAWSGGSGICISNKLLHKADNIDLVQFENQQTMMVSTKNCLSEILKKDRNLRLRLKIQDYDKFRCIDKFLFVFSSPYYTIDFLWAATMSYLSLYPVPGCTYQVAGKCLMSVSVRVNCGDGINVFQLHCFSDIHSMCLLDCSIKFELNLKEIYKDSMKN